MRSIGANELDEMIYRGEGNSSLVVALKSSRKVIRLLKSDVKQQQQQQQAGTEQEQSVKKYRYDSTAQSMTMMTPGAIDSILTTTSTTTTFPVRRTRSDTCERSSNSNLNHHHHRKLSRLSSIPLVPFCGYRNCLQRGGLSELDSVSRIITRSESISYSPSSSHIIHAYAATRSCSPKMIVFARRRSSISSTSSSSAKMQHQQQDHHAHRARSSSIIVMNDTIDGGDDDDDHVISKSSVVHHHHHHHTNRAAVSGKNSQNNNHNQNNHNHNNNSQNNNHNQNNHNHNNQNNNQNNNNHNNCNDEENDAEKTENERIRSQLLQHIDFNRRVLPKVFPQYFFSVPQFVALDDSQLRRIRELVKDKRPPFRLVKRISACRYALLMPDYCCIPKCLSWATDLSSDTLSIEIKPKQGFLSSLDTFAAESELSIKSFACRFGLSQFVKLQKGSITGLSSYCPIDLFSGERPRAARAIAHLIDNPQNNLRVFRNARLIFGDAYYGKSGNSVDALKEILEKFFNFNALGSGTTQQARFTLEDHHDNEEDNNNNNCDESKHSNDDDDDDDDDQNSNGDKAKNDRTLVAFCAFLLDILYDDRIVAGRRESADECDDSARRGRRGRRRRRSIEEENRVSTTIEQDGDDENRNSLNETLPWPRSYLRIFDCESSTSSSGEFNQSQQQQHQQQKQRDLALNSNLENHFSTQPMKCVDQTIIGDYFADIRRKHSSSSPFCYLHQSPPSGEIEIEDTTATTATELPKGCVLDAILRAQKFDTLDTLGAAKLFDLLCARYRTLKCAFNCSIIDDDQDDEDDYYYYNDACENYTDDNNNNNNNNVDHHNLQNQNQNNNNNNNQKKQQQQQQQISSSSSLRRQLIDAFVRTNKDNLEKLWRYLISLTAKDCSIMLAIQRADPAAAATRSSSSLSSSSPALGVTGAIRSACTFVTERCTGRRYVVSIAITDLDQKQAHSIRRSLAKDRRMISLLRRVIATGQS